jgi:RNA polymerase sigma-70 factor (ECF subfamily)
VDDAAQEVFVVASRRLDDIAEGAERAFLYGTAIRVASDARRALARRLELYTGNDTIAGLPDKNPSPEDLADRKRAREILDQVLSSMKLELRSVFVLYELEGLTMAEIAELQQIPPGTVASRLRRAREIFRKRTSQLQAQIKRRQSS